MSTAADPSRARSLLTRFGSFLGLAIGLAGMAFVARLIVRDWDEISESVSQARPGLLVASVLIGLGGLTIIGINWVQLVYRAGGRSPLTRAMSWYFVGQLGKYVPGGIWPVVGRAELAARAGVGRRAAYTTTAASMFSTYFSAGVVGASLLPLALGAPAPLAAGAPLVVFAAAAAAFHPSVTGRLLDIGQRVTRRQLLPNAPAWRPTLITLARHLPAWGGIALATWAIARALGIEVDFVLVAAATPASWLAGFVIIGLPGGLGVRESVFVTLVATQITDAKALSVALLARVVFVGVDILGAMIAMVAASLSDRMRGDGDDAEPLEPSEPLASGTATSPLAGSPGAGR